MYFRVPNKFKTLLRRRSNTCLPVHYNDATRRNGSEEVTGWTTAECVINSWLGQRISVRHLLVEIQGPHNLLQNGHRGQSGRGVKLTTLFHLNLRTFCTTVLSGTWGRAVLWKAVKDFFKEVVMAQFKALSWHFLQGTEGSEGSSQPV